MSCVGSILDVPQPSALMECEKVFESNIFYFLIDDEANFLIDDEANFTGAH